MSAAPKFPDFTLDDGHPTLRLISSYPKSTAILVASDRSFGSFPPSCRATGCSIGLNFKNLSLSPKIIALSTIISLYNIACCDNCLWKYLQCLSVQSIIGATLSSLFKLTNQLLFTVSKSFVF